ncbi:MAG: XrtA-associated tyrosine autokinase [Halioglobus sp.]|nr:XrtA-associated tyrosine autokinase [Halioglobus sp.]
MSIIEKAVNALSKGGGNTGADAVRGDLAGRDRSSSSTVERASGEAGSVSRTPDGESRHSAPADHGGYERTSSVSSNYVKLNFEDLRDIGILTPSVPRSAIAEEYRTIKRPLLMNIAGDDAVPPIKHGNLIMVTSALEGDGKTFTSISLAISIAMEQDKTVLFVDADTAKAEAGRILGIPSDTPGLIDVLEDNDIALSDVILHTNIEKLRILPAGDLHTHANELLASDRMRQLMIEMSERHPDRVIVFDSPPLLLTTEASVLASFMGQIVFVVSADMTPQHAVTQAIEHIGEDKMVGMVLNRARRRSNPYYYTYGEVYGYGRDRQYEYDLHGESG